MSFLYRYWLLVYWSVSSESVVAGFFLRCVLSVALASLTEGGSSRGMVGARRYKSPFCPQAVSEVVTTNVHMAVSAMTHETRTIAAAKWAWLRLGELCMAECSVLLSLFDDAGDCWKRLSRMAESITCQHASGDSPRRSCNRSGDKGWFQCLAKQSLNGDKKYGRNLSKANIIFEEIKIHSN